MTWTYTAGGSTRDYIRLLILDTDSTNQIFQDEELDVFLAQNSSDARLAGAQALESLASKYARNSISYSITGFSLDRRAIVRDLLDRAAKLREDALQIPSELESTVDSFIDAQGIDRSNYDNTPLSPEAPA